MNRHETCAEKCSLSSFLKREEEACEDGYCELQVLTDGLYRKSPITRLLDQPEHQLEEES